MRPDPIRDQGLNELGANARLREITHLPNGQPRAYEDRQKCLEQYKLELKKLKSKTALECHPDRTSDLPEEEQKAKHEKFVRVSRAIDFIMQLTVNPPRPVARPMPMRVFIQTAPSTGFGSSSTTANSTYYSSPRVVFTGGTIIIESA